MRRDRVKMLFLFRCVSHSCHCFHPLSLGTASRESMAWAKGLASSSHQGVLARVPQSSGPAFGFFYSYFTLCLPVMFGLGHCSLVCDPRAAQCRCFPRCWNFLLRGSAFCSSGLQAWLLCLPWMLFFADIRRNGAGSLQPLRRRNFEVGFFWKTCSAPV